MKTGRTPLKTPPLHNPGESLQEQRDEIVENKFGSYLFFTAAFIILAIANWAFYLNGIIPHPAIITLIALISLGVTGYKTFPILRQVRSLNRGIAAEKSVGQFLEQFHANGYKVFHDVPGQSGDSKFNLDHVVVGPGGIYTIETKYRRKPAKGRCDIIYDGQCVVIDAQPPDSSPISQASAQARWLNGKLQQRTGKSFSIKPLVVFPGWWIESKVSDADVWVMNDTQLGNFLKNRPARLSPEDVALASDGLTTYIQSLPTT